MLWAVLQFALPAVASAADAHVEREGRAQVAHVESTSTSSCRPVHPAECALCQLITSQSAATPASMLPAIAARVPGGVVAECLTPATAWLERLPLARAPPLG
jgi:hypothetical protein